MGQADSQLRFVGERPAIRSSHRLIREPNVGTVQLVFALVTPPKRGGRGTEFRG